nr:MAG TPA: hypothetical protein [Crassvirales sp.]
MCNFCYIFNLILPLKYINQERFLQENLQHILEFP